MVRAAGRSEPPPLAREERPRPQGGGRPHRTTPAGAGRTPQRRHHRATRPNHPRWRRKNVHWPEGPRRPVEPPPLAREELRRTHRHPRQHRTTPAGAGRTCGSSGSASPAPNHPRWRGKNARVDLAQVGGNEPPPLAREEQFPPTSPPPQRRTTPAGAGRTGSPTSTRSPAANHPRWRGKNARARSNSSARAEPPPLAREERLVAGDGHLQERTTPAGAGRTLRRPICRGCLTNHPRWRGKNHTQGWRCPHTAEPPPLAREERMS